LSEKSPQKKAPERPSKLPPMLQQYQDFKSKYPDCILFFQVGDFYEVFFEDALIAANALNITLTTRDKNSPEPIPMCGVPIAVVETYSERLVNQGFSVALVSQAGEVPAKGMVNRELDRIITPGIRLLGGSQSADSGSIVAAIFPQGNNENSIVYSDVQSGEICVREGLNAESLYAELSRIEPKEIIIPREIEGRRFDRRVQWIKRLENIPGATIKFRFDVFASQAKERSVQSLTSIPGYSVLDSGSRRAVSLLVTYVDEVTVSRAIKFSSLTVEHFQDVLVIDATTRRNLELVKNSRDGGERGTLFEFMNRTITAGGARLLRQRILSPLINSDSIRERLSLVEYFRENRDSRLELRTLFKSIPDVERVAARIELGIALPRELASLRDALRALPVVKRICRPNASIDKSLAWKYLQSLEDRLSAPPGLENILAESLLDDPAAGFKEGGIIRDGYDPSLDRIRQAATRGRQWIMDLEASERKRTGVPSLKIKYNGVLNYFFELSKTAASKAPEDFIKRQSTTSAERFTTTKLNEISEEVLSAGSKQIALEKTLFEQVRESLLPFVQRLRKLSFEISNLDTHISLAELAEKEGLVCPVVDSSNKLSIVNGRHPVLEKMLKENFIPNSTEIVAEEKSCHILTGPNMGGKSTFLRQAGLICIMAQAGSFVPADSVHLGIVDKIFARIGASDDILEGDSTFMVEMKEASHIITTASKKSLLLIDELGRGTATADGLAISQAVLEWIVTRLSCRTIFATHFHELTKLQDAHPEISNFSVGSLESSDGLIFTHEICPGAASSSYGIEVARRAGLPLEILQRAEYLVESDRSELKSAEKVSRRKKDTNVAQLALFTNLSAKTESPRVEIPKDYEKLREIKQALDDFDVSRSTPLEALRLIDSFKQGLNTREKKKAVEI